MLLKAIILEDRRSDAELMAHELQRAGFDLTWEQVDTEAEFIQRLDSEPDVILADYSLPGFTSMATLQHLQDRSLDIPFIVVTGTERYGSGGLLEEWRFRLPPQGSFRAAGTRSKASAAREGDARGAATGRARAEGSERRFRQLAELCARRHLIVSDSRRAFSIEYVSSPSANGGHDHWPHAGGALCPPGAPGCACPSRPARHIRSRRGSAQRGTRSHCRSSRGFKQMGLPCGAEQRDVLCRTTEGHVVAMEGIARDVTERKQADARCEESQASLQKTNQQLKPSAG